MGFRNFDRFCSIGDVPIAYEILRIGQFVVGNFVLAVGFRGNSVCQLGIGSFCIEEGLDG